MGNRIGFVSTRLAGTDGVSLEVTKWVSVLNELGMECFYFAGQSEWPAERSHVVAEAHFNHPDILKINSDLFDDYIRSPETTQGVERLKNHLKNELYTFVRRFDLQALIIENAMAIPMNVPLGLALTEFIAETEMPTIAHHHDFSWERKRFAISAADDYLRAAFPSNLNAITHVVINSFAQRQLALRTGASSMIVPNVMDFDHAPANPDGYADDLRTVLGLGPEEKFLLQPTRVVPRKRIELAIGLTRRLDLETPCTLVISHGSGDEGSEYGEFLLEYIQLMDVRVVYAADHFADQRGRLADGQKIYSLGDAYQQADLVTYPSTVEGFGNAFLEAIYYRKPIVMSTYEIYRIDIQPKGFRVVEFGDYITNETVAETRRVLQDKRLVEEMVDHNYHLARRHYSFSNLEKWLASLISLCLGDQ